MLLHQSVYVSLSFPMDVLTAGVYHKVKQAGFDTTPASIGQMAWKAEISTPYVVLAYNPVILVILMHQLSTCEIRAKSSTYGQAPRCRKAI